MSWAIGYDNKWKRDVGYGVPSLCDHPDCEVEIDRGLAHVCKEQQPKGGDGCGLYFCEDHQSYLGECERCQDGLPPFTPKPDLPLWVKFKMQDVSWAAWREENGHPEPTPEMMAEVSDW